MNLVLASNHLFGILQPKHASAMIPTLTLIVKLELVSLAPASQMHLKLQVLTLLIKNVYAKILMFGFQLLKCLDATAYPIQL
jgi:hypothetical protein